jgi:hypothetical protein
MATTWPETHPSATASKGADRGNRPAQGRAETGGLSDGNWTADETNAALPATVMLSARLPGSRHQSLLAVVARTARFPENVPEHSEILLRRLLSAEQRRTLVVELHDKDTEETIRRSGVHRMRWQSPR